MHTLTRQTPSKYFRAATCVLSLLLPTATQSSSVSAQPPAAYCGLSLSVPEGLTLRLEAEAPPPLCVLRGEGGTPTPYINSLSSLPWNRLDQLRVDGQPLRTIGFFRLRVGSVTYGGRPSYEDGQRGFAQHVLGRPKQSRGVLADGSKRLRVRTELRVKWLKPRESGVEEEVEETIVCLDEATWDGKRVAVFNWCASKDGVALGRVAAMLESLSLAP